MVCVMEGQEEDARCNHSCIREEKIIEELVWYRSEVQAQLRVELTLLRCQGIDIIPLVEGYCPKLSTAVFW